jgi:hypothetical protein
MLTHDYTYTNLLDRSVKNAWRVEDCYQGRDFDFAKSFLPERIAGVRGITCLNDDERRKLNQIRGNSYCHIFAFVEEYIVPMVLANASRDIYGDETRLWSLLRFAEEEVKHHEMLRRAGEQFEKGFAEHRPHRDAVVGVEGLGSLPEADGGDGLFVVVDFAVGEAGVVVDRGVHERVADPACPLAGVRAGVAAATGPPATTGRDLGQLLDIDVHEITGVIVLVAAHHTTCGAVHPRQTRHAVADQDTMHRRGVHLEPTSDARRSELVVPAQRHDATLHLAPSPRRAPVRATRTIQPPPTRRVREVTAPPLMCCRSRHVHLFSDCRDRNAASIRRASS